MVGLLKHPLKNINANDNVDMEFAPSVAEADEILARFGYVEEEDTPRPLMFQIDMLRRVGFEQVEILHKNNVFAAFGAMKTT